MKRALGLAVVVIAIGLAFVPSACSGPSGNLGVGAPCFNPSANDGGGESLGTCDPTQAFCAPPLNASPGAEFVCVARPSTPYIWPDRFVVGFGAEFGNAVYVGTSPQQSLQIFNEGQSALSIQSAALSGPQASKFSLQESPSLPATVDTQQEGYIQVTYTPTAAGADTAVLTITSNGANTPPAAQGVQCSSAAGTLCIGIQAQAIQCTPITVCPCGDNCGVIEDGCGGTLNCGTCMAGYTCTNNQCVGQPNDGGMTGSCLDGG